MTQSVKAASEILDEMALKILMVEPGDLSVVGELLELGDQFMASSVVSDNEPLRQMGTAFKGTIEKMIMAEFPDSAENYDRLGKCIAQMQEVVRKGGEVDETIGQAFVII